LALFQANEAHSANSHSWLTAVVASSIFLPQYNVTSILFVVHQFKYKKLGEKIREKNKKEERDLIFIRWI
jgi:hypothetical protein